MMQEAIEIGLEGNLLVNCMLKSVAIRWTLVAASLGLLAVAVFVMSEGVAFTHFLGYDSVDDCEIRWDDDTAYDTERVTAINAWNALTGDDDCVEILEDTILTITDLIWTDQYRDDVPWIGLYVPRSIADLAILNEYHGWTSTGALQGQGTRKVRRQFMHEGSKGTERDQEALHLYQVGQLEPRIRAMSRWLW